jgi:hypothetical protein
VCQGKITHTFINVPNHVHEAESPSIVSHTYPEKRENDFVRVAQNRFHKKTVSTALPKAKTAFQQTETTFL